MSFKKLILTLLLILPSFCYAQSLVLTKNGLKSSVDETSETVSYVTKSMSGNDLYKFCKNKLSGMEYLAYEIAYPENSQKIEIVGYLDGTALLSFGATEIKFKLIIDCTTEGADVSAALFKTNGNPISYSLIFDKNGNIRVKPTKKKVEKDLNNIVNDILSEVVNINR